MQELIEIWRKLIKERSKKFKELCELEDLYYGEHSAYHIAKQVKTDISEQISLTIKQEELNA